MNPKTPKTKEKKLKAEEIARRQDSVIRSRILSPTYNTVDYSSMKDFLNWGMNRALSDIRLRRMVDVKIREERMKKGHDRDWMRVMIIVIIVVICGGIAFGLITQFFNYQDMAMTAGQCLLEKGMVQGQYEACQQKLSGSPPMQIIG